MKVLIHKKHQKEILKFKKLINKHRAEEDKIFEGLVSSMHLKSDSEVEIIFDHIYNDTAWCVEYTKE